MNNETKGFLLFLGGVVWAAVTSKKAYAPNINQFAEVPNTGNRTERNDCSNFKPPCPDGCMKFQKSSGFQKVYYEPECLSPEKYKIAAKRQELMLKN